MPGIFTEFLQDIGFLAFLDLPGDSIDEKRSSIASAATQ
jgi:hypothetical protein